MALSPEFRLSPGKTVLPSEDAAGDGVAVDGFGEIGGETSTVREQPRMKQNSSSDQFFRFRIIRSQN